MRNRWERAFTLIELMIVVAIIGVLASIAIPAFMKYIRKSKSTEAGANLRKMYEGARSYFMDTGNSKGSTSPLPPQFPDAEALTPAGTCCGNPGDKCAPAANLWDTPTWDGLKFAITDPHYYRYEFGSSGSAAPGVGSFFTVRALGNLDCDAAFSTFEMYGVYNGGSRDITGSAATYKNQELE